MPFVFAESEPVLVPAVSTDEGYVFGESDNHVVTINGQRSAYMEVSGLGIQGPPGEPGLDAFYQHDQMIAAAVWNIVHNLNKYPSVTVITSAGDEVVGNLTYLNSNEVRLIFSAPFAGTAYLN